MGKLSSVTMLLAFMSITACNSSPESTLRKNTEALLMANLNDASSYEFVAIDDLEAMTVADTLILHLQYELFPLQTTLSNVLESRSNRLVFLLHECAYYSECDDERMDEARKAYSADSVAYYEVSNKTKAILERSDLPESKQEDVGFKALFRYRANNATGAKELREMRIYSDLDYKLHDRFISIKP